MKTVIAIIIGTLIAGCTVAQNKIEAYQEAASKFAHPDKIKVCYVRDGNTVRGFEVRCFGEGCTLPECP